MTVAFRSPCPVASALDLFGDKWTLVVIRTILAGRRRYSELAAMPERISTNILADRLVRLEELGLISKKDVQVKPPAPRISSDAVWRGLAAGLAGACRVVGQTHPRPLGVAEMVPRKRAIRFLLRPSKLGAKKVEKFKLTPAIQPAAVRAASCRRPTHCPSVDRSGKTRNLNIARLIRHAGRAQLGPISVLFKRHCPPEWLEGPHLRCPGSGNGSRMAKVTAPSATLKLMQGRRRMGIESYKSLDKTSAVGRRGLLPRAIGARTTVRARHRCDIM